jgi:hypothetical protein
METSPGYGCVRVIVAYYEIVATISNLLATIAHPAGKTGRVPTTKTQKIPGGEAGDF